jgi:glycosyltransferase involved in cell wall biosynthesis
MLLSVLIATLESRKESLNRLLDQLHGQMDRHNLRGAVEILPRCDRGEEPIGRKRNRLVESAAGEFIAFVDDDDTVSDDYLPRIHDALELYPDVDCLGIKGEITFNGKQPRLFVHSLQYRDYFTRDGTYYRPPYHLNPMRRAIASRYRFAEVRYSEDVEWALRMRRDGALRSEHFIDTVLYHYHSRRPWAYQWLLDHTETVRHALGLRLANRIRVKRLLARLFGRPGDAPRLGERHTDGRP